MCLRQTILFLLKPRAISCLSHLRLAHIGLREGDSSGMAQSISLFLSLRFCMCKMKWETENERKYIVSLLLNEAVDTC